MLETRKSNVWRCSSLKILENKNIRIRVTTKMRYQSINTDLEQNLTRVRYIAAKVRLGFTRGVAVGAA